jgi:hypothetical protein
LKCDAVTSGSSGNKPKNTGEGITALSLFINPKASMESLNDILSPPLQVPPLEGDQKAEFRLCIFGAVDPITGEPVRKPLYGLSSQDRIRDQGKSKVIMNIKDLLPVQLPTGGTKMEPQPGMVYFDHTGIIICTQFSNDLYYYLKRHNKNKDNPYRDPTKTAVFYEVNEKRDLAIQEMAFEYKMFAGGYILQADQAGLNKLVSNLNQSGRQELAIDPSLTGMNLRRRLEPLTQQFASEILLFSGHTDHMMTVVVDYAITNNWIIYNDHEEVQSWLWSALKKPNAKKVGKKDERHIVTVPAGDDPRKFLKGFLIDANGSSHYAELKAEYKKLFKVNHF